MAKTISMGMNRTGMDMSPEHEKEMLEASDKLQVPTREQGDQSGMQAMRKDYISQAAPVGSVPDASRSMSKALKEKLNGHEPAVLIDKLGERLAFERSGVRLYDLFLLKCEAEQAAAIPLDELRQIREEELRHFKLVEQVMQDLGADPTALTPDADISGVASMGIIQVLADPRTTVPQSLKAILTAELVDNAGWELLVGIAAGLGLEDVRDKFHQALREEEAHLDKVKNWYQQAILSGAV